jgi:phosphatidylserine/phosphatidylglycerophosphate/cardiolipin synthase-like enzyme
VIEDAELVGGVLVDSEDLDRATRSLAALLYDFAADVPPDFDADLVRVLRAHFGRDQGRIDRACGQGAAWVAGRRSVVLGRAWELVASLPAGASLPPGLRRTTGETIIHLVVSAKSLVRIVAPFMDRRATTFLSDALAAATSRGVRVEVLSPTRSTHADAALSSLEQAIRASGDVRNFSVVGLRSDAPWVHLKLVSSDIEAAYIGSANVTTAGIGGPNLELGVLVYGPAVRTVHRLLDMFEER